MVEPELRRRRQRWPWVVLVLAALLAVFIYIRHSGAKHQRAAAPQSVGVATAVAGPMPVVLTALGTVTPLATVTVLPQLSGYLTEVAFTEGETVQAGQFLAQIDPRPYQINLEQYQGQQDKDRAALGQARSDLARYQLLGRQNSIAAQQITDQRFLAAQDEAAIQIDQANIDTAKLDLAYCHITSPVAGRVGLRLVDVGNYVTSGSTTGIAVVTTHRPDHGDLQRGADGTFAGAGAACRRGAAAGDRPIPATTARHSPPARSRRWTTRSTPAPAWSGCGRILPTPTTRCSPTNSSTSTCWWTPCRTPRWCRRRRCRPARPRTYVYVLDSNNVVSVQNVTTGPTDGVNTVVANGLKPGDVVVTDGVDRLADGAKVSIATGTAPTAANGQSHKHRHARGNAAPPAGPAGPGGGP